MTNKQIKQNAFEYYLQNCCVYDDTGANDMDSIREAFIAGTHSRDEEIAELKETIKQFKNNKMA